MNNHDDIILKVLLNKKNKINSRRITLVKLYYPNILKYLESRYDNSSCIQETIYRMSHKINIKPICPMCGNYTNYLFRENKPYSTYCSVKCKSNSNIRKQRYKETCKKKYGVEYALQNENIKLKGKQTCLNKYGCEHPFQNKAIQEKYKHTMQEKYGCDWNSKTEKWKTTMSTKISSFNIQNKRNLTMMKNHTFNTSKPEEELYLYIKEKFPLVKRQYRDKERYPWNCDFYIPELDLFLELNGNWTHGKHAFSSTDKDDLYIVECWKKKVEEGHLYYGNAIKTWTIYDVKKRNKAKEEHLYYKEVWGLEEGKEFIDSLTHASSAFTS